MHLVFKVIYFICFVVAYADESAEPSTPESVTHKSSRHLLNKPEKPSATQDGDVSVSTAEKYMHELKAWALDTIKRQHRQYAKSQMRTILRNTDTGYVGISPSKITCRDSYVPNYFCTAMQKH